MMEEIPQGYSMYGDNNRRGKGCDLVLLVVLAFCLWLLLLLLSPCAAAVDVLSQEVRSSVMQGTLGVN